MKTIKTDKGELILKKYMHEFPFFCTVEGTLNGKEFEYFCGMHLDNVEQETLSIDGFEDFHNFEDLRESRFDICHSSDFTKKFGICVSDFTDACKNFIKEDFKTSDDFIVYSFFGEIENIEIIKKAEKHNGIYFLIKDKTKSEFFELVIPECDNANFGGECWKLLTDNIDDAIEEFIFGNIVEKEEINLYI